LDTDPSPTCSCGFFDEARGDKVIRRLQSKTAQDRVPTDDTRLGLVVDVETTGLTASAVDGSPPDEIIEFAAVPFTYRPVEGTIVAVHEPFSALNRASHPVPAHITALTGIDDAMIDDAVSRGEALSRGSVEDLVEPASLIVCHNSGFDRRFLEAYSPIFAQKPFACTIEDAGWREEGVESPKLVFIAAMAYGFSYEAHRGVDDCLAVIEILRRRMPVSGVGVLAKVLASARSGRIRVRAHDTPFTEAARAALKRRGYRWDPGRVDGIAGASGKCWFLDVLDEVAAEEEQSFLGSLGGRTACVVSRLDAFHRFSDRAA
jgi:DNA polymerase-3 subunit epsilon